MEYESQNSQMDSLEFQDNSHIPEYRDLRFAPISTFHIITSSPLLPATWFAIKRL